MEETKLNYYSLIKDDIIGMGLEKWKKKKMMPITSDTSSLSLRSDKLRLKEKRKNICFLGGLKKKRKKIYGRGSVQIIQSNFQITEIQVLIYELF